MEVLVIVFLLLFLFAVLSLAVFFWQDWQMRSLPLHVILVRNVSGDYITTIAVSSFAVARDILLRLGDDADLVLEYHLVRLNSLPEWLGRVGCGLGDPLPSLDK